MIEERTSFWTYDPTKDEETEAKMKALGITTGGSTEFNIDVDACVKEIEEMDNDLFVIEVREAMHKLLMKYNRRKKQRRARCGRK